MIPIILIGAGAYLIAKSFTKEKFAKGGALKYYDKDTQHRIGRPSASIEKDILEKVKYYSSSDEFFVGSFGWKTPSGKLADGYLYKLNDYDENLVKNIKLKPEERIFLYFNRTTAIGGMTPMIKINLDKELLYFLDDNSDDEIVFKTRGVQALWIALIEDKMAYGGAINMALGGVINEIKTNSTWEALKDFEVEIDSTTRYSGKKLVIPKGTQLQWLEDSRNGNVFFKFEIDGKKYDGKIESGNIINVINSGKIGFVKDSKYGIVVYNKEYLKNKLDNRFGYMANGGGVGEPYDSMTKYQLDKEYKKLNEKRDLLKKKYGNFQSDEITENEKEIEKILTLLYGENFSGVGQKFKYADGGMTDWQTAKIGDSALVISENKLGLIIKDYGRKFHLKFPNGREKTYDASELKFMKFDDEFADGGIMARGSDVLKQIYDYISNTKYSMMIDDYEEGEYITIKDRVAPSITSGDSYDDLVNKIKLFASDLKDRKWGDLIDIKFDYYDEWVGFDIILKENDKMANGGMMAMGGVTFEDKVKSIKKSLLKGKKVSPSVQKDYGKTYSAAEAEESARRIVGSMTKKRKYAHGGGIKNIEVKKEDGTEIEISKEEDLEKNTYYSVYYEKNDMEIQGDLIPYNTRKGTEYEFSTNSFNSKDTKDYYSDHSQEIIDEILKVFYENAYKSIK